MGIKGIGTTMYQWGVEYQERGLIFEDHLSSAFNEMAATGFDGVESRLNLANTPEKAVAFKRICEDANVKVASLYSNVKLYDRETVQAESEAYIEAVKAAATTGCSLFVVDLAHLPGRDKTTDEWQTQAEALNRIGDALKPHGIRIGLHNHTPEMKDNAREFHYMMKHISGDNVGVCLDIAWCEIAGVSAEELIDAYHDKLFDIHVRNLQDGHFTQAVMEGTINYSQIIDLLLRYGYDGWLIAELAYMPDVPVTRPFTENISRSAWYLKGIVDR